MKRILTIIAACALSGSVLAEEKPSRPAPESAQTLEGLKSAVEEFKGFGCVQSAHFERLGQEIVVLWYSPYSGRAACYLHGYYFDPDAKKWTRFLNDFVEGTQDLSAAMPCGQNAVVVFDVHGKEVRKLDVSKFPRKKWEEKKGKAAQPAGDNAKRTASPSAAKRNIAPAEADELYEGYANDVKLLRDHYEIESQGKTIKASSGKAVGAAHRLFAKASFLSKTRDEVLNLLGDPSSISDYGVKMEKGKDAPIIYRFDTGFGGAEYKLTFRHDKVVGVECNQLN